MKKALAWEITSEKYTGGEKARPGRRWILNILCSAGDEELNRSIIKRAVFYLLPSHGTPHIWNAGFRPGMNNVLEIGCHQGLWSIASKITSGRPSVADVTTNISASLIIFSFFVCFIVNRLVNSRIGLLISFQTFFQPYRNFWTKNLIGWIYPRSLFLRNISAVFEMWTVMRRRSYVEEEKGFYDSLVLKFKEKITCWKDFKPVRSIIEGLFKLTKKSFALTKRHRYTMRSGEKSHRIQCTSRRHGHFIRI